jgi:hypothetical protein
MVEERTKRGILYTLNTKQWILNEACSSVNVVIESRHILPPQRVTAPPNANSTPPQAGCGWHLAIPFVG